MPNLTLAAMMLFFAGIFSINFISLGNTTVQLESVPEMRGRVMSFWTVAFLGSTPIGGPIIGWVGERFGARWALTVGGVAAVAAAIYGAVIILKKKREAEITSEDIRIRDGENEARENTKI